MLISDLTIPLFEISFAVRRVPRARHQTHFSSSITAHNHSRKKGSWPCRGGGSRTFSIKRASSMNGTTDISSSTQEHVFAHAIPADPHRQLHRPHSSSVTANSSDIQAQFQPSCVGLCSVDSCLQLHYVCEHHHLARQRRHCGPCLV